MANPDEGIEKQRLPLLFFTGGADSTYMLLEALDKSPVDIMYVSGNQDKDKINKEKLTISQILCSDAYFGARNKVRNVYYENMSIGNYHSSMALPQAVNWFMAGILLSDPQIHSKLCIGYVMGDDAAAAVTHLRYAWDYLVSATKHGPERTELEFPLINTPKTHIYKYLKSKDIFDITWSCEIPKRVSKDACGKCGACITRRTTLFKMAILNEDSIPKDGSDPVKALEENF